ncbi:MAG: DMT family transporter [Desulfovibrio sp.]|uniref:DMT family transporter n=1 Tax=Desulfovibrio sp. 7SRBS1 TaxID=3378064 RepID=UPI003B3E538D
MIRGALLAILSAICFGCMAVQIKLAYGLGMDEWDILICRFVFGSLFLFLFLTITGGSKSFKISFQKLLAVAATGMVVYVAQSLCFSLALKYISASTTALIFYGYPATVTLLSVLLGKAKPTRTIVTAVISVSLGCGLVFFDAFSRGAHSLGLAYALGALSIFSLNLLMVQWLLQGEKPLSISFYMILFTAVGYCIVGGPQRLLNLTNVQLVLGASLGLIPTAMAIGLLYQAIERVGSAYASIFSSFEPLATLALAHFILGDSVVIFQIVGAAFILYGIILPNLRALQEKHRVLNAGGISSL